MYSRSYYPEESEIRIPENYDGTALYDIPASVEEAPAKPPQIPSDAIKKEIKISPNEPAADESEETFAKETRGRGLFGFDLGGIFGKLFQRDFGLSKLIPKLDIEELLIIGLALFLFFSKDGDRECALMLLALIFIT